MPIKVREEKAKAGPISVMDSSMYVELFIFRVLW